MGNATFRPAQVIMRGGAEKNGAYVASAMRKYARKAGQHNISWCCGRAEGAVRALVMEKKLPSTFILTENFRHGMLSLDGSARFACVEQLALCANGRRVPTTYHLLAASAIGGDVAIARHGDSVHGRAVEEWVRMARELLEQAARNVEHFYGKNGRRNQGE